MLCDAESSRVSDVLQWNKFEGIALGSQSWGFRRMAQNGSIPRMSQAPLLGVV